jgi:hypothetical protein
MKVGLVTFAFVKPVGLYNMVDSAGKDFDVLYVPVHSPIPAVHDTVVGLIDQHDAQVYWHNFNRGLARSLNDVMVQAFDVDRCDVLVNANDDTLWGVGDLRRLTLESHRLRKTHYAVSATTEDSAYSAIALNRTAYDKIGMFDENFFPAYWEDVDYSFRATRLGLLRGEMVSATTRHGDGEKSIDHDLARPTHVDEFIRNRAYFHYKWGNNYEYATPWELGWPMKIMPEVRRAPYGSMDRPDLPSEPL